MADTQSMINDLLAQTQVSPQPSFMGLQAPPDPQQLQALLAKLKQQKFADQYTQPTGGEYGYLHDAGKLALSSAGSDLGNDLTAPGGLSGPGPNQPPQPSQGQSAIGQALQQGKQAYAAQINAGVDPDTATLNTMKLLTSLGVPGADQKLAEAQKAVLDNNFKKSETDKDTSQAAMDRDEIKNRAFDQKSKTYTTTQTDPAGFYEIQTSGTGEDRRVELKPKPTAGEQALSSLSPEGLDYMVQTYKQTGVVPTGLARSPIVAGKFWTAIAKDPEVSADPNSPRSILANKMAQRSNGDALTQTQKQLSATTSYFQTMDKNIDKASELAKGIDFGDVKGLNAAVASYMKNTSDPAYAKYNVFFDSIANEYAKIKSGSLGNSPVSDSARKEAMGVLSPLIGTAGVDAAFDAVRQEGQNRLISLSGQRDDLIATLQGRKPSVSSGAAPMGATPGTTPTTQAAPAAPAAGGWGQIQKIG